MHCIKVISRLYIEPYSVGIPDKSSKLCAIQPIVVYFVKQSLTD